MHLIRLALLAVLPGLILPAAAVAQQQQPVQPPAATRPAQPQTAPQQPTTQQPAAQQPAAQQPAPQPQAAQPDPKANQPETQPIVPQAKKPTPPAQRPTSQRSTAPRRQTMQFDLPPLVPIAEIPLGQVVAIQGQVKSPQPTTFVLNDGNASQVIHLGPSWRDLTGVKAGDRIRVIGQMDPYGSAVFRAGSIMLEDNRIVVVPTK